MKSGLKGRGVGGKYQPPARAGGQQSPAAAQPDSPSFEDSAVRDRAVRGRETAEIAPSRPQFYTSVEGEDCLSNLYAYHIEGVPSHEVGTPIYQPRDVQAVSQKLFALSKEYHQ